MFKRKKLLVLFAIISLILQYSGLNMFAFMRLPFEMRYSLGRLAEVFPYAVVGALLWKVILGKVSQATTSKRIGVITLFFSLFFVWHFDVFTFIDGFGYQGMETFSNTVLIFLIGIYLDSILKDKIPSIPKKVIGLCSSVTMGIFCIHILVGRVLVTVFEDNAIPGAYTIGFALLVWLISLGICLLIYLLSKRFPLLRKLVS